MKRTTFEQHAFDLAMMFTDEISIPARFKKDRSEKIQDSQIERNFQENIKQWQNVISQMRGEYELKDSLITRIVRMKPIIEDGLARVTENEDFMQFTDYFVRRRNSKHCSPDELGRLAMLHTAFQRVIEKRIDNPKKTTLKNEKAQSLREEGAVTIEGIEMNFWQKNSFQSIEVHETWNKIKSYAELNSRTTGDSGNLVFTGAMQIPRREMAEYAIMLGFKVNSTVSKNTNFVVVGSENVAPNKIAAAMELRNKGYDIKLIDENSFLSIVLETIEAK